MPNHHDDLEPSPAQLGETMTVQPAEWTPLDDEGTEIYLYGDRPMDIAVQVGAEEELRQLRAEVEQLRRSAAEAEDRVQELRIQLDSIGSMQVVEHEGRGLRVITSAMHDRLCKAKVGTPQGTTPEVLHCAFCGFCYPPTTVTRPYPTAEVGRD